MNLGFEKFFFLGFSINFQQTVFRPSSLQIPAPSEGADSRGNEQEAVQEDEEQGEVGAVWYFGTLLQIRNRERERDYGRTD